MKSPQSSPRGRLRSCYWDVGQIPGLSEQDRDHLLQHGIRTTQDLLQQARTQTQRQALATHLKIHVQYVNKWTALADLARIPAVGCQYCGLLLHAGISSPQQLAQTPLSWLHRHILKLQVGMMQRQDLCPDLGAIAQWIDQAHRL